MAGSTSCPAEGRRGLDPLAVWVGLLAVLSVVVAGIAVSRSAVFHARTIEVRGASHLSRAEVLSLAQVSIATNVVWLDEAAIERMLTSHAWVADADVRASLPATIRIRVVERSPVAVAVDGARRLLVAGDGTILGPETGGAKLPSIEVPPVGGPEGPKPGFVGAARALGAMEGDLRSLVRRVAVGLDGTLEVRMRGGLRVSFGLPSQAEDKVAVLARVLAWAQTQGQPLGSVSVVAPGAPAVSIAG